MVSEEPWVPHSDSRAVYETRDLQMMLASSVTRLLGSRFLGFKIRKLHLSGETGTLFNRGAARCLGQASVLRERSRIYL